MQNDSIDNVDALVTDLNSRLQGLVASISTNYSGTSATYFDFGEALLEVRPAAELWNVLPCITEFGRKAQMAIFL